MTLTNDQRIAALQLVDADLLWLHQPHRPPCPDCEGGRIGEGHERRDCHRCDGIGSLRPQSRTSVIAVAHQILANGDLQAAIVRAERPEGATKPTEGSTGWSDPTGEAATSEAAVEIRANQAAKCWQAGLHKAYESVRTADNLVRDALGLEQSRLPLGAKFTVVRIRMMTAHDAMKIATRNIMTPEQLAQLDHAIETAAEATTSVRHGRPAWTGKPVPSVNTVLELARRTVSAAPPKPKQQDRLGCRNCQRFAIQADVAQGSTSLCSKCIEFRKAHAVMPTEAICRRWHDGHRGWTPTQLLEAKAQAQVKRKVRAG